MCKVGWVISERLHERLVERFCDMFCKRLGETSDLNFMQA